MHDQWPLVEHVLKELKQSLRALTVWYVIVSKCLSTVKACNLWNLPFMVNIAITFYKYWSMQCSLHGDNMNVESKN